MVALRAESVVLVGGPTGPSHGPRGPTGPVSLTSIAGMLGPDGPLGRLGPTGMQGQQALASLVMGVTGHTGGYGSNGRRGPAGPTGPNSIVPAGQFRYFENIQGLRGIPYAYDSYAGSNFTYTLQNTGLIVFAFSGLVENTFDDGRAISVSAGWGTGDPPQNSSTGIPGTPTIYSGLPFFIISAFQFGLGVGATVWFDMSATVNQTVWNIAVGGIVRNINCVIMEF